MTAPDVSTSTGPLRLGAMLGKGGEGAVYEVMGRQDTVAKIYLKDVSPERAEKLAAMQSLLTPKLASLTAWPSELLRTSQGRIAGFLMPNMRSSKDIHALYGPRSRLAEFPQADWRMLVRAALNTARAFAVLHEADCLVADVNHGGIRVAPDATVKLIDCDSFQVRLNAKTFLCEVGVENFTPPELQGVSFRTTLRTTNHDNFGLAVLVFHLLMMGRHPFAGRYRGAEDMPIPKAIGQFRYAYGRDKAATGMEPPPNTPAVSIAGDEIVAFWEQSFGRTGTRPGGRPSAEQWVRVLQKAETAFARCDHHSGHFYLRSTVQCPWCPIERIGVALFPFAFGGIPSAVGGVISVDAIWARIGAVRPPGSAPPIPSPSSRPPSNLASAIGAKRGRWLAAGVIIGLAVFAGGTVVAASFWLVWAFVAWVGGTWTSSLGKTDDIRAYADRQRVAKQSYDELAKRWSREASDTAFVERISLLQKLRLEWTDLPALRQRRYTDLLANRVNEARRKFLDKFEIEKAVINGVGPAKKSMLESYGIETAADVTYSAVIQVPGFGPALTKKLVEWRVRAEKRFVFPANGGVDPQLVSDMDRTIQQRKLEIEKSLSEGLASLHQTAATIISRREALMRSALQAADELGQADADLAAVS